MLNKVNRASQFMPFDALNGFSEALRQVEKQVEEKKVLSIDQEEILNQQFQQLQVGDFVRISFFYQTDYIELVGFVKKIDFLHKWIIVSDTKISLEDIFALKKEEFIEI